MNASVANGAWWPMVTLPTLANVGSKLVGCGRLEPLSRADLWGVQRSGPGPFFGAPTPLSLHLCKNSATYYL